MTIFWTPSDVVSLRGELDRGNISSADLKLCIVLRVGQI